MEVLEELFQDPATIPLSPLRSSLLTRLSSHLLHLPLLLPVEARCMVVDHALRLSLLQLLVLLAVFLIFAALVLLCLLLCLLQLLQERCTVARCMHENCHPMMTTMDMTTTMDMMITMEPMTMLCHLVARLLDVLRLSVMLPALSTPLLHQSLSLLQ